MRKSFEENIRQYNEIAKDELEIGEGRKPNEDSPELAELKTVLDWETRKDASARETSQAAQLEIYALQRTKQNIFQKLKRDLATLDTPGAELHWEKGSKEVVFKSGEYFFLDKNGVKEPVAAGEIFTDGDWGLKYAPGESVPREIRKRYIIETAKRKMRAKLDRQIYIDEIASQKTGEHVKSAYTRKLEEEEFEGKLSPGILAEKMVNGLLKKMSFIPGVNFEILEADVHLDVVKKIDFMIRRKNDYRGVKVEAEDRQELGVQFTTITGGEKMENKRAQIARANALLRPEDRLDRIVLVSVPLQHILGIYEKWKTDQKPGGPEKLWGKDVKRRIFAEVLKDMFSPEEIEGQWQTIEPEI